MVPDRAGGLRRGRRARDRAERDVTFEEPEDADHRAIEDAYRTEYARYARTYVEPMVSPVATAAMLRLAPRWGNERRG